MSTGVVTRALQFSDTHQVPAERLRPSEMIAEIIALRDHLGSLLRLIRELDGTGVDSGSQAGQS